MTIVVGALSTNDFQQIPAYWLTPTAPPTVLSLLPGYDGGNANAINSSGQIIGFLSSSTVIIPVVWLTPTAPPTVLSLLAGYDTGNATDINNSGQIIGSVNTAQGDTPEIPVYWSSSKAAPTLLKFAPYTGGIASGINDTPTVSNICFPAGTPITTDQGSVAIEQLIPNKHTIKKQAILHITQTTTLDKYLISFPKSSLSRGLPSQSTIMSKDHKIEFNGQLAPAYRFLDYSSDIKKVKYNGEILYNVLLAEYGTIQVNGLTCETLHPNNAVAKLYQPTTFFQKVEQKIAPNFWFNLKGAQPARFASL